MKKIHDAMLDADSDLKLLYVTPEKLAKSKMFMNKLQKMYDMGRFSRLVIDEVINDVYVYSLYPKLMRLL